MSKKFFIIIIALIGLPLQSFADDSLQLQFIQNQFIFDNSTIKNVSIEEQDGAYRGLHIQLNPSAVPQFERMTKEALGKHANLVLKNRIISSTVVQSPMGGDLIITGLTKEEALEFVNTLNQNKPKTD